MKFLVTLTVISLLLILFGPSPVTPQAGTSMTQKPQEKPMSEQAMQEMMMKYGAPVKQHEFLKKFVGTWTLEIKTWMNPGDAPLMSTGIQTNQLIFDGRYVECKFEMTMGPEKLAGLEIIGYDSFQNKYVTFWIDSMSTAFTVATGSLDPAGMVLTQTGKSPDSMMGIMQMTKEVTTFMPDGKYKFELFMVMPDGKDFKSMEFIAAKSMK